MGFVTQRLQVRRLTMEDLEAFHGVWGDQRVIFWGPSPDLGSSRGRLRELLAQRVDGVADSGWFAVERRADGQFVGDVVLEPASWDPEAVEVGWHVGAAWQRRGYATEAVRGLLDHARGVGVTAAWAKILPDNTPSRRLARRVGLRPVRRIEHAGYPHDLWVRVLE